jgi:membrane associated rhomboid family serine protease
MIPIRDVVPSRTFPVVTLTLIAINVLVFLYELWLGPGLPAFLREWGLVPARFSFLTLFTSLFLHTGILHVGGSALFLWIFGDNVEDRLGRRRFVLLYLLCGTVAAAAQLLTMPASRVPIVGAGGAIAGVMGAYFVLYRRSKIVTLLPIPFRVQLIEVPAVLFLIVWFLIQFLSGLRPLAATATAEPVGGIAFWAHAAGLATGAVAVLLLKRPERLRVEWWDH